jgi:hypothetical protein
MIINQRWILGYIIPLSYRFSDMPKNYKPYYNSRLSSIFGSLGLPISPSLKFVLGGGYTEIPFCNHFIRIPMQKVNSSQTIGVYIISMVIIFSKWILDIYYISRQSSELTLLFCCFLIYVVINWTII